MIVVEELASIPPRKRLSIVVQPSNFPKKYPVIVMKIISTKAVMEADPPTRINFLKLNSRPRLKRRMITPISAKVSIFSRSATVGTK
jgi:hypothetical protein